VPNINHILVIILPPLNITHLKPEQYGVIIINGEMMKPRTVDGVQNLWYKIPAK
jgi:hypothetical protein